MSLKSGARPAEGNSVLSRRNSGRRAASSHLPLAVVAALVVSGVLSARPAAAWELPQYRKVAFPVQGGASYVDTFGAPRDGGARSHQGQDLFAAKLTPLVATTDGTIAYTKADASGNSGNMLILVDSQGWGYWYLHLNNDTPGTDDGVNPTQWIFAEGIEPGAKVKRGQMLGYLGDSGNAETTPPHVHFEIRTPDRVPINAYASLRLTQGLRAGDRCAYDTAPERTPAADSGRGIWTLAGDGGIFAFGDADFYGSTGAMQLNQPIVGMGGMPDGQGYWLVARDGGIFAFGDAAFYGSTGNLRLNQPIVGMASTPTGHGYWLVATDGGIFAFGDAAFYGSTGNLRLNQPIVGMAPSGSKGAGYWLVAADGGVFNFGDAAYLGSLPGDGVCSTRRAVGIEASATGLGYWIQTGDGALWEFGDAVRFGDVVAAGVTLNSPAVGGGTLVPATGGG